jgi:hypothetical protein
LEAEFEKLGNEKPQQTRFLRSQQDLKAKMEARMTEGNDANEGTNFLLLLESLDNIIFCRRGRWSRSYSGH